MGPSTIAAGPALQALERWAPVVWLKLDPYAYPTLEIVHLVGIALVYWRPYCAL